jgi:hypothetical protein
MRNLYVAVGLALCSTSVLAADFGVGISARSDDGIVYVPIDISKSFRIEPSIRYASTEWKSVYDSIEQESEELEVGIGVFGLKQVTEAARIYYGARLAYVNFKTTFVNRTVQLASIGESDQDGYRIGPTVGFEYLFGQHFSVGGEASYSFLDLEGDSTSVIRGAGFVTTTRTDVEQKSHGTQTRLIFRYMF